MKKGCVYEGYVERVDFPNKGVVTVDDDGQSRMVIVKNAIPGQTVRFRVNKNRNNRCEGQLLEVISRSPLETAETCPHFGQCGGCTYQSVSYDEQLKLKSKQVVGMLSEVVDGELLFEGIIGSPRSAEYRNKMEYSFGDEYKGGPLALGLHRRNSTYDIVSITDCRIVDRDFSAILDCVRGYAAENGLTYMNKNNHEGFLRHLLVRKSVRTGQILVDFVTTSQSPHDFAPLAHRLRGLSIEGTLAGVLHTFNDSLADAIKNDRTDILYGQDYIVEELLGLQFKITPFSFFQTNSLGAEVLYSKVREYVLEDGGCADGRPIIFDLYSGTGTIAQMLSPVARKVVGVEIVAEAVSAARENAERNGLDNCEFIADDVLKALDYIEDKPDFIVLDPPRDGIHPKALAKIIDYGVDRMVYISCKPTSLARDLVILQAGGYKVSGCCCVDMFPGTSHVETVVLMSRAKD